MSDMTKTEMRELDAWIAKNVERWDGCDCKHGIRPKFGKQEYARIRETFMSQGSKDRWPIDEPDIPCDHCPRYTEHREHALKVLETCAKRCFVSVFHSRVNDEWCVDNRTASPRKRMLISSAETLPLAICLFAKQLFTPIALPKRKKSK